MNASPWATRTLLLLALLSLSLPGMAADSVAALYRPFQAVLERHLVERALPNDGLISAFDYEGARSTPATMALLRQQSESLAAFDIRALRQKDAALAFWINAYNFFMVQHLLENPRRGAVVDSVRDYGSLINPYRVFRQSQFDIGGRRYSLDQIEKDILLGQDFQQRGWKDARVHFAVNCASVGCPPLRQQIYTAENVEALLVENTRRALNTPYHLRREGETLFLTQLFQWYVKDYVEEADSVRAWLLKHADARAQGEIAATRREQFIPYDWSLNRPDNFPELNP